MKFHACGLMLFQQQETSYMKYVKNAAVVTLEMEKYQFQGPNNHILLNSQVLHFSNKFYHCLFNFHMYIIKYTLHSLFDDEIYWLKHLLLMYRIASIFKVRKMKSGVLTRSFFVGFSSSYSFLFLLKLLFSHELFFYNPLNFKANFLLLRLLFL